MAGRQLTSITFFAEELNPKALGPVAPARAHARTTGLLAL
jgi:hypothetical protein